MEIGFVIRHLRNSGYWIYPSSCSFAQTDQKRNERVHVTAAAVDLHYTVYCVYSPLWQSIRATRKQQSPADEPNRPSTYNTHLLCQYYSDIYILLLLYEEYIRWTWCAKNLFHFNIESPWWMYKSRRGDPYRALPMRILLTIEIRQRLTSCGNGNCTWRGGRNGRLTLFCAYRVVYVCVSEMCVFEKWQHGLPIKFITVICNWLFCFWLV